MPVRTRTRGSGRGAIRRNLARTAGSYTSVASSTTPLAPNPVTPPPGSDALLPEPDALPLGPVIPSPAPPVTTVAGSSTQFRYSNEDMQ